MSVEWRGQSYEGVRWIPLDLRGGWVSHSTSTAVPAAMKDASGRVWLRGAVKSGGSGALSFVLPADFRPRITQTGMSTYADNGATANAALVRIDNAGNGIIYSSGNSFVNLDGLSFDTRR